MAMINRNDGLARYPIQSDGHDHLDPMTVMAALQGRESNLSVACMPAAITAPVECSALRADTTSI